MSSLWDPVSLDNPHAVSDKRRRVQRMFAAIAGSYDLNNRLHSLGLDQSWRRRAVALAQLKPTDRVIDVACGTGDLTLAFWDQVKQINPRPAAAQIIGIDFTYQMLPLALAKWNRRNPGQRPGPMDGLTQGKKIVRFINGDAQALPLPDASCDVASIAFGIRNVADPAAALGEFFRVLRPAGRVLILEFSLPKNPLLRGLYNFYFRHVLPHTATWISGDKTGAYHYLPQSVNTFISRQNMLDMMGHAGFVDLRQTPMTFGICVCYRGVKP